MHDLRAPTLRIPRKMWQVWSNGVYYYNNESKLCYMVGKPEIRLSNRDDESPPEAAIDKWFVSWDTLND